MDRISFLIPTNNDPPHNNDGEDFPHTTNPLKILRKLNREIFKEFYHHHPHDHEKE